MIFLMRTDATGRVPRQDIDLVTSSCLSPGFSWTVVWIERLSVKQTEVPLLVPMTDERHQRTAEARTLGYYFLSDVEQAKVRRALGPLSSAGKLILRRLHVPETERHLLKLDPESVDERLEPGRKKFLEEAKYSTMFEVGTWEELGVIDFVTWAKQLEDPFVERIVS